MRLFHNYVHMGGMGNYSLTVLDPTVWTKSVGKPYNIHFKSGDWPGRIQTRVTCIHGKCFNHEPTNQVGQNECMFVD